MDKRNRIVYTAALSVKLDIYAQLTVRIVCFI